MQENAPMTGKAVCEKNAVLTNLWLQNTIKTVSHFDFFRAVRCTNSRCIIIKFTYASWLSACDQPRFRGFVHSWGYFFQKIFNIFIVKSFFFFHSCCSITQVYTAKKPIETIRNLWSSFLVSSAISSQYQGTKRDWESCSSCHYH